MIETLAREMRRRRYDRHGLRQIGPLLNAELDDIRDFALSLREQAGDPGVVEAMRAARMARIQGAQHGGRLPPPTSADLNAVGLTAALNHILEEGQQP